MNRISIFFKKYWKYLLLILISILLWVVYSFTTLLNFSDVQISLVGNKELVNVSEQDILTNINYLVDTKFLDLDSTKLEHDIKRTSPFVDSVFIFKDFPNKISILLIEKTPIISLEIESKKCVLFDEHGFVLKIEESDCKDQIDEFNTILVTTDAPKVDFSVGTVSNYNQLFLITKSIKILNELEIPVLNISIKDNIARFVSSKQKVYVISFNQEIESQLARLIAVVSELEKKGYKFKSIDLRFKRPVLTIK